MKDRIRWRAERQSLRKMLGDHPGQLFVALGVASGADARQLHYTVHELVAKGAVPDYVGGFITFVSGYLCAAQHGLPDLGLVLRGEMVQQTDLIEQATYLAALATGQPAFPIGVDIDTGYGNEPASVAWTCRQVHKQGAQYVQIEDQYAINKSCGHMAGASGAGKQVVTADEMVALRLGPATSYAASQEDFSVMARTDAAAPLGIDEAIGRAERYAAAGADMVFVEAPRGEAELRRVADAFRDTPTPSVANMIEGSPATPYKSPQELHELGFDIALYCVGSLLAGRATKQQYYSTIATGGSVLASGDTNPEHWFDGFNRVIGREQVEAWNRFFHGSSTDGS